MRPVDAIEQQMRLFKIVEQAHRNQALSGMPRIFGPETVLSLEHGETFAWSQDMSRLVATAATNMPTCTLVADMLPAPYGFFWFDEPLPMREFANHASIAKGDIFALSWAPIYLGPGHEGRGFVPITNAQVDLADEVTLTTYCMDDFEGRFRLMPPWSWRWRVGDSLKETLERQDVLSCRADPMGLPLRQARLRYFAAALLLLQQRVIMAPSRPIERHARRRLERDGWRHDPAVRVVELRRKASSDRYGHDHPSREWSCQWVVRGHWRQQPYRSTGTVQPKWILPHVKGPEDKPLKHPRATVFTVVR